MKPERNVSAIANENGKYNKFPAGGTNSGRDFEGRTALRPKNKKQGNFSNNFTCRFDSDSDFKINLLVSDVEESWG